MNKILFICFLLLFASCSQHSVYYRDLPANVELPIKPTNDSILNSVFLIGDAGGDTSKSGQVMSYLEDELKMRNPEKTAVVFLGDNIYPEGLHKKDHPLRGQDEQRINRQLDAVSEFKGELFFIPGNHDWKKGKREGLDFIKRQEDYIQDYLNRKVFDPSDGCAGPKEINLGDELTLIIIDTQWWLHDYEKARGEKDDCSLRTESEFIEQFKEILKGNREKQVLVLGHHPLYSNGFHGGYFTWRDHLFPLSRKNPKLWIPLPVIGSIYPFYRSFFGNRQDIPNAKYQQLRRELLLAMNEYENVVYAAGHEHNLQYLEDNHLHHIVSGAGSKGTPLRFNKQIEFGAEHLGLARLDYFESGAVQLNFIKTEKGKSELLYNKELYRKKLRSFGSSKSPRENFADSLRWFKPDEAYEANKLKRAFFGDLNRDLWCTAIPVPYLDLQTEKGGLKPVSKGGGMQTLSLKLEGADGYEYKLRGIKKSADFLVSRNLRGTLAQDIIYDGIAGSHPYAALAVPKMAKAAGLYYTEPRLVYIPRDSVLGDYMDEFGDMFCLFEIHPDDDMTEFDNFGNSKKVLNYHQAIKKLEDDPKNQVDVPFTVRSRLFDLFLGDWDRHDDQWRWATFEEEDKRIFRPIPRDRDQVFFKFDGLVMKIANRKWLLRKFQNFDADIRDVAGLSYNARYFDRYFLNQADWTLWQKEVLNLQESIKAEDIRSGLKDLPEEAYAYNGQELEEILLERKKKLMEFARDYYLILAKEVDVRGSLEKDFFEVIRFENGDVEVNVYPRKDGDKIPEKRYYHRLFKYGETKEIRLYGLDDKDEYHISGDVSKSILVRIIGSENKDKVKDISSVKSWGNWTRIYDEEGKGEYELAKDSRLKILKPEDALIYNRKEFKYDVLIPIPSVGVNPDDGLYIGPGFRFVKHGFKKQPYKYYHDFNANYALRAEGFNLNYEMEYVKLLGGFDFGFEAEINNPEVFQFYGLGNETKARRSDIGNSDVRINRYAGISKLTYSSADFTSRITAKIGFELNELEKIPAIGFTFSKKENQAFWLTGLEYQYQNLNNPINPSKGIKFNALVMNRRSTLNDDISFVELGSSLTFYIPINYFRKTTTLALRTGASTLEGNYNFYQANFLNGLEHMRGITRNRFAGERISYSNAELRKSFFEVKNYIAPFDWGLLVHYDLARLWVDGEHSELWHSSIGGGTYISVLDFVSFVLTYSVSDVDEVVNFGTKFYF